MTDEVRCISCGKTSITISASLGLCRDCIITDFEKWRDRIARIHAKVRANDGLPEDLPQTEGGVTCKVCGNECRLGIGEIGYCGLRKVTDRGHLSFIAGSSSKARVSWYLDPLPTNCVADWVCCAGSACGYPQYSHSQGAEYGYYNLAVFYEACSFDCLFCQNWHYRSRRGQTRSARDLANNISDRVSCICFFGGDPGPQVIHALAAARIARRQTKNKILRICWETNGNVSSKYLKSTVQESMETGGTIKVDIKVWSEPLGYALCGRSNRRTLEVVRILLDLSKRRPEPPLFVASTLLVPGYVDASEVGAIAKLIASVNPMTPYSLLAFAPCFWMSDLPPTSVDHAETCLRAALDAGLERVRIGNRHLLGKDYKC